MRTIKDLTNKRFGSLLACERLSTKQPNGKTVSRWKCVCDCGNICYPMTDNLIAGQVTCGCKINRIQNNCIPSGLWQNIKQNAKVRKLTINCSKKALHQLFTGKCYLTGEQIQFGYGRKWWLDTTASLDRIDSSKNYTIDNCAWCHKKIQAAKNDLTVRQFLWWCNIINNPINDVSPTLFMCVLPRKGKWTTGFGNIRGQMWASIVCNARNRKIKLNLTIKQAWQLFVQQCGRCAISGIPLSFNVCKSGGFGTASLDRINSCGDYTIDNTQWIHNIINTKFKSKLSQKEMYFWTRKVLEHENCVC